MFYSPPYLGMIPILTDIFQMGWFNHQLVTSNVVEVAVKSPRVWNGWTQRVELHTGTDTLCT